MLNTWIEFGNRLLTYPLVVLAGLTFIAFWRYSRIHGGARRDLVRLSALLPLEIIAQAVVGGIVVLTKLNPAMVSMHFLLSAAIVAAAVVLHARTPRGLDGPDADRVPAPLAPPARAELRVLAGLLVAGTGLMLIAGTVVTGSGPLAGTTIDSHGHVHTVPRYHFPLESVTQLHADIGWAIGTLAVAVMIGLWISGAPRRTVRTGFMVLVALGIQGTLGYIQYFSHLPAGLVWVHVSMSGIVWVLVLRLFLTVGPVKPWQLLLRPELAADAQEPAADAAGGAATPPVQTTI